MLVCACVCVSSCDVCVCVHARACVYVVMGGVRKMFSPVNYTDIEVKDIVTRGHEDQLDLVKVSV